MKTHKHRENMHALQRKDQRQRRPLREEGKSWVCWGGGFARSETNRRVGGKSVYFAVHLQLYVCDNQCVCVLQYEYDSNETGDRVVLGRGTYGVVYAGRDLSNQVRIAIKEIPERDSR